MEKCLPKKLDTAAVLTSYILIFCSLFGIFCFLDLERLDLVAHERIAYCGCFVFLWGMVVLREDAGGLNIICKYVVRLLVNVVICFRK